MLYRRNWKCDVVGRQRERRIWTEYEYVAIRKR